MGAVQPSVRSHAHGKHRISRKSIGPGYFFCRPSCWWLYFVISFFFNSEIVFVSSNNFYMGYRFVSLNMSCDSQIELIILVSWWFFSIFYSPFSIQFLYGWVLVCREIGLIAWLIFNFSEEGRNFHYTVFFLVETSERSPGAIIYARISISQDIWCSTPLNVNVFVFFFFFWLFWACKFDLLMVLNISTTGVWTNYCL